MSRRTAAEFRKRASQAMLEIGNYARRVVVAVTQGGLWGVLGYETEDDGEGEGAEPVDVFQGIGIYARPGTDDNAEAIMLHIGGKAQHPTLIATRNEDARRRYVETFGELEPGAMAIFNSPGDCRVIVKPDGTIEAGGTSVQRLATESDANALHEFIRGHAHAVKGAVAEPIDPTASPTPPVLQFTSKLKGE